MSLITSDLSLTCKACGGIGLEVIYSVSNVPVNSVVCIPSRQEALAFPRGDIRLYACHDCGFVFNALSDPALTAYADEYESTQSCSPTFNKFHENLADELIERYQLYNKNIIEIGCGQGEFLHLLAEKGGNHCTGYDPAYRKDHEISPSKGSVEIIKDYYALEYVQARKIDFICCKMTLEHIPDVLAFMISVRQSLRNSRATVFFQVPNFELILKEAAFQDVFYEHCSYFTAFSLRRLFLKAGFRVLNLWTGYDNQYLMIEALPGKSADVNMETSIMDPDRLIVSGFAHACSKKIQAWENLIHALQKQGKKAVVWSSSSKAVAFLTAVKNTACIEHVVDINPRRQGFFMAGTGQEIVAPSFLLKHTIDAIIIMNPIYYHEIKELLHDLNINTLNIKFFLIGS